jgi:cell division initiation protein
MKLTALDIKQQKFEKAIRGYDIAEVGAFLGVVATEWEHLSAQNRALQAEVDELKQKLLHYSKVEEALHETLHAARENAESKLAMAKTEAENRLHKAEIEAENMLRDARQQRQEIRQGILRLLDRREEIIRGMRGYLDMAKESLQSFESDPAGLFDLPTEDREDSSSKTNEKKSNKKTIAPGIVDVDQLLDGID